MCTGFSGCVSMVCDAGDWSPDACPSDCGSSDSEAGYRLTGTCDVTLEGSVDLSDTTIDCPSIPRCCEFSDWELEEACTCSSESGAIDYVLISGTSCIGDASRPDPYQCTGGCPIDGQIYQDDTCCTLSCSSLATVSCGAAIGDGCGGNCSVSGSKADGSCAPSPSFDCAAADKVHILTAGHSFTSDVLVAHTFNLPNGSEGDSYEVGGDCGSCGYTSRAFCKSDGTWLITYPVRSPVNGSQYQDPGNDSSCESPTGMFVKTTAQWALENPTYACSSGVSSSPSSSGIIPSASNCAAIFRLVMPGTITMSLLTYNTTTLV